MSKTTPTNQIFIFAGEKSGDLHGAELMHSLKSIHSTTLVGVGGPKMRQEGLKTILQMEDFQVMGFTDVILALPKLVKQFKIVKDFILKERPLAVVLIDYPGFNLRMAKALRKEGYQGKIVQYISPSVWAYGKKRIPQMAATLDLLLTIYPFEAKCFSGTSLNLKYVGNPIVEILNQHKYNNGWREELGIPSAKRLIAIFPGSRKGEIKNNLTQILIAAKLFKESYPEAIFGISIADDSLLPMIMEKVRLSGLKMNNDLFFVDHRYRYELMRDCHTAVAKSGTVTLELALHQRPTVVVYQLSTFNRFIAKYLLRLNLPYYCIVNILMEKAVFPELIASGYTPESLNLQLENLVDEGEERSRCIEGCLQVKSLLAATSPSSQAALAIADLLSVIGAGPA